MVNFQPLSDTAAHPTPPIHQFTNTKIQVHGQITITNSPIHKSKCTVNCRPLSYPTAHPVPPAPNHRLNRSASAHHSAADIIFAQFFPQLFTILPPTSSLPHFVSLVGINTFIFYLCFGKFGFGCLFVHLYFCILLLTAPIGLHAGMQVPTACSHNFLS